MQATVVMLIALGGLGCQNPADNLPPIPPAATQPANVQPANLQPSIPSSAAVTAPEATQALYPGSYGGSVFDTGLPPQDESFGDCLRDTICSFVLGRSPDVPSAGQIEAAYRAGYYRQ